MASRSLDDDDDFDYSDHLGAYERDFGGHTDRGFKDTNRSTAVANQPHDEEVELSTSGDSDFGAARPDVPPVHHPINSPPLSDSGNSDFDRPFSPKNGGPSEFTRDSPPTYRARPSPPAQQASPQRHQPPTQSPSQQFGNRTYTNVTQESQPSDNDEPKASAGGYNALEYRHLPVSDEVRDLFKFIGRYKPHSIELETRLRPFLPDYIPATGGIDEFIKVPRPDGKPDFLGLKVLDEPATRQSDPAILNLQLRQMSKTAAGGADTPVSRIEHGDEQKAKRIAAWVSNVAQVQASKPPASVSYSQPMPDIEELMAEWPPEMEGALRNMRLPQGDMDVELRALTQAVCGLLDIPVYDNPVESLHLLFSTFLEFKSNPVFGQAVGGDALSRTGRSLSAGSALTERSYRGRSAGTATPSMMMM